MSEPRDGLHGWMRWVVVIAALLTISDAVYDGVKGFKKGFMDGFNSGQPSQTETKR